MLDLDKSFNSADTGSPTAATERGEKWSFELCRAPRRAANATAVFRVKPYNILSSSIAACCPETNNRSRTVASGAPRNPPMPEVGRTSVIEGLRAVEDALAVGDAAFGKIERATAASGDGVRDRR
jgi:hypothetical protein